ncbi:MAG: hypothetical protein KKG33_10925 [candidate division Zixibacteria bacterium]|nr:hypothetical protein [candidate division Zixibacteria bacterium]
MFREKDELRTKRFEWDHIMNKITPLTICIVVLLLSGCAEPPDKASTDLSARFDNVVKQRLDRYLPEIYAEAKDSFDAATAEISAQSEKFALTRSYGRAEMLLAFSDSLLSAADDSLDALRVIYAAKLEELKLAAEEASKNVFASAKKFENIDAVEERMVVIRGKLVSLHVQMAKANTEAISGLPLNACFDYENVIHGAAAIEAELKTLK